MAQSDHVKKVVQKSGGVRAVCAALNIKPSAISMWDKVPAEHLFKLAALSDMQPAEMRPDLMPAIARIDEDLVRAK